MSSVNIRSMPEELVRRSKAQAALRGITLRDFVIEALEKALQEAAVSAGKRRGQRVPQIEALRVQ